MYSRYGAKQNLKLKPIFQQCALRFLLRALCNRSWNVNFHILSDYRALKTIAKEAELDNTALVYVHLYELLYRGGLKTGGPLKAKLKKMLPLLKGLKEKHNEAKNFKRLPLYVRVNTLLSENPTTVIKLLQTEFPDSNFTGDPHINFLLKFPSNTNFSKCSLYRKGQIIIQDKASCMSAAALAPPRGTHVIDACSAPGNKTLHVSALLENTGSVFAIERDGKRFNKLRNNVKKHGAKNITPVCEDFLKISPLDPKYSKVTHILVDPSCSGSGMVTENLVSSFQSKNEKRVRELAALQKSLLAHALSFPHVQRVVYSTCSVYSEENENVVKATLDSHSTSWKLSRVLPTWERRGDTSVFPEADMCVRCSPEDETNGFFLACFVRKEKDKDFLAGVKLQSVFSVRHLAMRYHVKQHYKYPYKYVKLY